MNSFADVRRNGRLLFKYDPQRSLIEIKPKGAEVVLVDLAAYQQVVYHVPAVEDERPLSTDEAVEIVKRVARQRRQKVCP